MSTSSNKKVIITAPVHHQLIEKLQVNDYEVVYYPTISYEELFAIVAGVQGLVVTTRIKIDRPMINEAQKLKWIGRLGSGMELIDEEYAKDRGVECVSTPEGNRNAVAEHTLALVLGLMNNVYRSFYEVKQGKWLRNENKGVELSGKTVGIIGYGNTGSSFAKLLQPFNVTVLAYDKYKDGFSKGYIKEATETHHMANENFFSSLQQKPFFITTCRGPVTDTTALINALKSQKISGAALDVLENEKINSLNTSEKENLDFLTAQGNVIITPHIAGYSHEAFLRMPEILLEKLSNMRLL
jgi:D-3-phosphoglycerate dehydrogenase